MRNPTALMWAQACELLAQAERLNSQFFRLTSSERSQPVWEPPVDMFEDADALVIVVALPGVAADNIEITLQGHTLIVRAERHMPARSRSGAIQRLEIPYGCFERRIPLPAVSLELDTRELIHGCLLLSMRKVPT
jgi:HSP20 family protein